MKIANILKAILLATAALPAAATAAPAGVTVKADVDSTIMIMGDLNMVHVAVDIPAQYASTAELVDFPMLAPGMEYLEYKGIDVVASDSTSTRGADGSSHLRFDFKIQAFDPGMVTLPPFAVVAAPGADTAYSAVVTFKVLPVDVDSLETINPMASIVSAQSRWYDYIPNWLLWTLLALAVAAAGVWAFFFFRKHKEVLELRRTPPVPPYDLAVQRLNSLRSQGLAESGHEKEYYTELVDILRQYMHGRFGINAMEMTSSQIVKSLRSNPETRLTADQMRQVLSMADFVKFAKVRPLPDDNIRAFSRAMDFVETTKPAPEPEPQEPDNTQNNNSNQR